MFSLYTLDILTNVTFFVSLFYALQLNAGAVEIRSDNRNVAFIHAVFAVLMVGLLYIPYGTGADRELYAYYFLQNISGEVSWSHIMAQDEWLFYGYQKITAFLEVPQYWLLLTAFIYVYNYYVVAKRVSPDNVYLMFLAVVGAFCFNSYGTNTIRSGLALSFVCLGFTYYATLWKWFVLFFIAYNIHHSTIIPIVAFIIARYYNRPKTFYYFWFLCVALSAVTGGYFTNLFAELGNDFDSRTNYLTTQQTHYNIGFRIDFILYSCLPIVVGHIYQNRLQYKNDFYSFIHSTYIISNAFWVLAIRANFSDRFAYLSWFLYALVMMYPLLENPEHFNNVRSKICWTLLGINLFTYFMYWK